jgi:hypothetical protein
MKINTKPTKMTPRQTRTAEFEAEIAQEWSEYYYDFMTTHDGGLFILDPETFSSNPNISLKTIENHPEYEWQVEGILKNPHLTWDFLKAFKDGRFAHEKYVLSMFRMNSTHYAMDYTRNAELREIGPEPREREKNDVTIEEINDEKLLENDAFWSKNIFPHHIRENPEIQWHYTAYAACNPNMTIDYLRELYDTNKLSRKRRSILFSPITNSVFTYDDIMENSDIPWNYKDFGENGTLKFDFILDNHTICDGVDYLENVCVNDFRVEKEAFLERRRREYLTAYKIQQWWWCVTSHPANVVCRRRLERDYAEMFQVTPN